MKFYTNVKALEDFEIRETSGDHLNYSIIKIGQNTEKSSADLKKMIILILSKN